MLLVLKCCPNLSERPCIIYGYLPTPHPPSSAPVVIRPERVVDQRVLEQRAEYKCHADALKKQRERVEGNVAKVALSILPR